MMPPHRHSTATTASNTTPSPSGLIVTPSTSIKSSSNQRNNAAEIIPIQQQPGHHRDKLERIRNSLKPFEQSMPYESQMYFSNHPNLINGNHSNNISIPSTSFPSSSSTNNYSSNSSISEKSDETQMFMINSLTQLGFDKESAYYALKLVNFSSVTDAANVLNRIKHDIALTQQIGTNFNNNNNTTTIAGINGLTDSSNNHPSSAITRTTTFYSSPARQPTTSNNAPNNASGATTQQQRLPRYTNLNGTSSTSTSTSTSKHTYLNISKSQTPDESRGSSRSESPNNNIQQPQRISPASAWNRNPPPPPPPMEGEFHRSHAKISLKHTTSIDPNNYMRNGPTIISRSPIGAMISAPPSSTVITIERDTTPQQKPLIRRIEGGVPVIRTRVERPHLPPQQIISVGDSSSNNSPGSSKQYQQQQQQQQLLHRQIEKATHSIQSIIVDPDINNSNSSSNAHHSTVNYVDQLKATRLTKERDSVLSLSDHASGGNVSPNRSSGFTSPAMLLSTTSDREPTPQPEGRIRSSSPLPASISRRLKTKTYENFVKPCKPGMYQFFMEQHIDSVIRQSEDRNHRSLQLLNEMAAAQFPETMQDQFLKVLRQKESKYIRLKRQKMDKNMFDIIKYVGVGAFGKVALVRKKDTQQTYAMKILSKEDVIQKKQSSHVKAERDILSEANSPWVVKLFFSFQDSRNLYFIMEFVPGGDMMQLLIVKGVFEEKLARFYIAELTCAVEYVHELGFIHRDIKPDNILIDRNGHIKLTDFGLCTGLRWTHDKRRYVIYEKDNPNVISHIREDSFSLPPEVKEQTKMKLLEHRHHRKRNAAHSIVGTANYMAPEVARQTGHTQNCDWWSVGVILYEMTFGRPPFMSQTENPHETQYKIMHWDRFLDLTSMGHLPSPLSENCVDMIARLCCEEKDRIGSKLGATEIKNHPWFKDIDFENLRNTRAEFIPQVKHAQDTSNFDVGDLNCQDLLKDATLKSGHNFNPAFYDFTFRHFFDYEGGGQPTGRQTQQRPSLAPLIEASSKQTMASTSTTMAQSSMPQTNGNYYNNEMPRQNDGKALSKQATIPVKSLASVAQQHQQQAYEQSSIPLRREPPLPQKPFTRILPSTNGKPFDRNAPVFVRRQQRVHLNGQLRRDLFPQSSSNNNQINEHENGESKL